MRRKDREIPKNDAMEILRKGEFGVLSMSTPSNHGYGVPLNYVISGNDIYFHCAKDGYKLECLKSNNKVSFCVVGKTEVLPSKFAMMYESAIVFGFAEVVIADEKYRALVKLLEKYSSGYIKEVNEYIETYIDNVIVIKISIDSITGKRRKI